VLVNGQVEGRLKANKLVPYEVTGSNSAVAIRDPSNRSSSGVLYKLVVVLSPNEVNSAKIENYDFVICVFQANDYIENFSLGLNNEIENRFWILMAIIVGLSILL